MTEITAMGNVMLQIGIACWYMVLLSSAFSLLNMIFNHEFWKQNKDMLTNLIYIFLGFMCSIILIELGMLLTKFISKSNQTILLCLFCFVVLCLAISYVYPKVKKDEPGYSQNLNREIDHIVRMRNAFRTNRGRFGNG